MNLSSTKTSLLLSLGALAILSYRSAAESEVIKLAGEGPGSYTTERPPSLEALPLHIYRSPALTGATPTNQWWSSLAWQQYSQNLFAHPLGMRCAEGGLAVSYPGIGIVGASNAIMGGGLPKGGDFTIGLVDVTFPQANYGGSSDWFLTAEFTQGEASLRTSFGHGSPYLFMTSQGGTPLVRCGDKPQIWAGKEGESTIGATIRGSHYGFFAASDSQWTHLDEQDWKIQGEAPYFSIALLPDNTPATLALFASHAHNHIVDTRVTSNAVRGRLLSSYRFVTKSLEKQKEGTIYSLYPHQWKYSQSPLTEMSYASVRGEMKVGVGTGFSTMVPIQGLLPMLPKEGITDSARLISYLKEESIKEQPAPMDTYWEGKHLGKLATLSGIAEMVGETAMQERFLNEIKRRLENWFTAAPGKDFPQFYYDDTWGTLIGCKASYGSDAQLNDHHFHYGYFIRAAAEVARLDPEWAKDWGSMVNLLIRDIASPNRKDDLFPYVRCFDFYAGHSWASGHADFADGNNQESSSESLNAWYGMMLWGEITGDAAVRDQGLFLFNTERTAVEEYWFDVSGTNYPESYPEVALGMVWGGKGAFATWFSGDIDCIHGINWLPFTPASIYMGRFPDYVQTNFDRIVEVREKGDDFNNGWGDLVVMFGALSDPAMATAYLDGNPNCSLEGGNTHAFMYHWTHTLDTLGRNDSSVTADSPFTNVYLKEGKKTYAAYNFQNKPLKVTFSDGTSLLAKPKSLTVK